MKINFKVKQTSKSAKTEEGKNTESTRVIILLDDKPLNFICLICFSNTTVQVLSLYERRVFCRVKSKCLDETPFNGALTTSWSP